LPNYILPLYPTLALLTARVLDRWWSREIEFSPLALRLSLIFLACVGVGTTAGCLVAGGMVPVTELQGREFHGLLGWSWVGGVLVITAAVALWYANRDDRSGFLTSVSVGATVYIALLVTGPVPTLNDLKASQPLAQLLPEDHHEQEIRLATCGWYRPSMVFYVQRQVFWMQNAEQGLTFLREPFPSYLFLPETMWEKIKDRAPASCQVLGKHRELYSKNVLIAVTNGKSLPKAKVAAIPRADEIE
jgi:hypothetical protein